MAIAINPDVRELDFSDNVKVSKFMQDFSDFRAKKWITYRPVNAPSLTDAFIGGTRQFIINMGTGHILDTTYSGLWFTLYFENDSDILTWPIQAALPRTSTAWIESVTFQHSNVAAHIDERMCDYDAVSSIFTSAKDILSMKQTFFTAAGQSFADDNMFNEFLADDPYGKLLPAGALTTGRVTFQQRSFFIPLYRLSTIFNTGKYFFPSLLRGNGEMTLSIRSVAQSLSEVFGGDGSSVAIYGGTRASDHIWSTTKFNKPVAWRVAMTEMKLVTLNLDNAFLTKEYNAFIASGRKFIRSFKGYNYQFYQVKTGYNRIEIANTHQSISHIILAFQTPYCVRINGKPTSAINDTMLGIQKTNIGTIRQTTAAITTGNYGHGPGGPPDDGTSTNFFGPAPNDIYPSSSDHPSASNVPPITQGNNNNASDNNAGDNTTKPKRRTRKTAPKNNNTLNAMTYMLTAMTDVMRKADWSVFNPLFDTIVDDTVSNLPISAPYQSFLSSAFKALHRSLSAGSAIRNGPRPLEITEDEIEELKVAQQVDTVAETQYRYFFDSKLNLEQFKQDLLNEMKNIEASANIKFSNGKHFTHMLKLFLSTEGYANDYRTLKSTQLRNLSSIKGLTPAQKAILVYTFDPTKTTLSDKLKTYLLHISKTGANVDPEKVMAILAQDKLYPPGTLPDDNVQVVEGKKAMSRLTLGGETIEAGGKEIAAAIVEQVIRNSMSDPNNPNSTAFTEQQKIALLTMIGDTIDDDRFLWHRYHSHIFPSEAKQSFDLGMNIIEKLQVYRGTGNGETVFSEPINENMFYHVSREAMGDAAEDHPFFNYTSFRKDMAVIVISLNTFMRDAHHEFWDGFSTNRVADRLYVEFESQSLAIPQLSAILPWYHDLGYIDNNINLNCKVFTVYDNIYYIDRNNNLNVSDTLLPLQEGRAPGAE